MNLPRIVHPFVVVLVLSLAATGLWAAAASEEPAAAAEKEMVLDPSTGEMVEAPQYGGTLTYGRSGLGEHTDYWYIGGWASHWISEVNEKLVIVDWALDRSVNNLRTYDLPWSVFVGALAESWETPDATTIIAHIRQGVHWHNKAPMNGRELTAADVEFNYHRLCGLGSGFTEASPVAGSVCEIVESVTATDDRTVVFKLTNPNVDALPNIFDAFRLALLAGALEPIEQHCLAGAARPGQGDIVRRRPAAEQIRQAPRQHCLFPLASGEGRRRGAVAGSEQALLRVLHVVAAGAVGARQVPGRRRRSAA